MPLVIEGSGLDAINEDGHSVTLTQRTTRYNHTIICDAIKLTAFTPHTCHISPLIALVGQTGAV
jgi:hypothetical protein